MAYSNKENTIQKDKKNIINNLLSYFGEILPNSNKIKEKEDTIKEDLIENDLKNYLNLLSFNNYNTIKEQIFEKIKDVVNIQYKFSKLLYQQVILEKEDYAKIISKLIKELDKQLPQRIQRKENNKKEYSEFRRFIINKCRIIFYAENLEIFDEYIKEKNPGDRNSKIKKIILGNINFMTELIKIEILSKIRT